ncbi:unnamed protein product [Heterobilharzia americana]|nr:unnamed protein product [Heterobilharzia americana]
MMSPIGLLSVCPINLHFLLHIYWVIGSWLVRSQAEFLVAYSDYSGHLIFSIERKWQLLMNICSLLEILFVTRQVSEPPHRSTDLTLVLKIRILFFVLSAVDLHTDFRLLKACHTVFPILVLTSSSVPVPPVVETILPR